MAIGAIFVLLFFLMALGFPLAVALLFLVPFILLVAQRAPL